MSAQKITKKNIKQETKAKHIAFVLKVA